MKIIFIHQHFRTPEEGGGIRSYYMSQALLSAGHEVVMITAHNSVQSVFKEVHGIKVYYLPVYYKNKFGFFARIFAFSKFMVLATLKCLSIKNPDICYASSSPLTIGIIAIILKKLRNIPFVFEVMDLWPEAPIQMGFIRNPLSKQILYALEKSIYKRSNLVVAASPGMESGILKASPSTPTVMIPNMSDCSFFQPYLNKIELKRKHRLESKFVCCYTGAIGLSNDLANLLDVALYVKNKGFDQVHFLIAGEGGEFLSIKEMQEKNNLDNVTFLGHLSKKEIAEVYDVGDVNLIFFNHQPILETNSPNKFFDGIAAGLPTIINIKGWIKDLCEQYKCGKYFNREDPSEFLEAIKGWMENQKELLLYSSNARRLAESKFSNEILLKQFLTIFENKSTSTLN